MLERDRRSHSSKTIVALKLATAFNLDDELKNVILVVFRSFAFLHSQGHSRPGRVSGKSGHVRYAPQAEVTSDH